jgi:hypothetical protein
MTPMYEIAMQAFQKLAELRKAALQTKPPPAVVVIDITGAPSETTIKGATTDAPTPRG